MMISYDTEVGAYYLRLTDEPIARTVGISDDVMVDVDAAGEVHGIELLCPPSALTDQERSDLLARFPVAGHALAELGRHLRPPLSA